MAFAHVVAQSKIAPAWSPPLLAGLPIGRLGEPDDLTGGFFAVDDGLTAP